VIKKDKKLNKNNKLKLILAMVAQATIAAYPSSSFAAELPKLQSVVETAVSTNPQVLQVYNGYESILRDLAASIGSNFLPSIDYTYGVGNEIKRDPITPGNGVSGGPTGVNRNFGRTNREIAIRQNLFNGFASVYDAKRLNYASRSKLYEVENTSQIIANDTSKAYIDLVRNRTLVSLAEDNYVTLKTLYEQLKQKADAGVAKKSDVEQAQSRLSLADYNLTVEGSNLHDNEARFQKLVGTLPPKEVDTNITISKEIPKDVTAALNKAQLNNPALVSSFEDIKAQDALSKQKLSPLIPRVDFKGFYDRNTNSNGIDGVYHDEGIQIDLTWNLFRGGADANSFAKERKLYDAAINRRDSVCRDVREQLEVGYNDIKKFTEQVAYLDQRQISIEKARDAYRKQFEINQRSLIDLLNAENELFEAKRAYTNAFHDLQIAYVRTHTQMGDVLQALGVRRFQVEPLPADNVTVVDGVSCPAVAPTAYVADRKYLDQRAQDAMIPALPPNGDAGDNAESPVTTKKGRKNKSAPEAPATKSPSVANPSPSKTASSSAFEPASPAIELPKESNTIISETKKVAERIEPQKKQPQNTAKSPITITDKSSEIISFVNDWAGLWSAKDTEAYLSKYASDFKLSKNQSMTSWRASRKEKILAENIIAVEIKNPKVVMKSDDLALIQFTQEYKTDTFIDVSDKILLIKNENGKWLIQSEKSKTLSKEMIAKSTETVKTPAINKISKTVSTKKEAKHNSNSLNQVTAQSSESMSAPENQSTSSRSNFVPASPAIEL
jgi:adhesin transport system outer membrane protein